MCLFFSTSSQIVRVRYANLGDRGVGGATGPRRCVPLPLISSSSPFNFKATQKLRIVFVVGCGVECAIISIWEIGPYF